MLCSMNLLWRLVPAIGSLLATTVLWGCEGFNRADRSFDRAGEITEVKMLTDGDFGVDGSRFAASRFAGREDVSGAFMKSYQSARSDPRALGETANVESAGLGGLAAAGVGLAIDTISKGLERDADRFQMQWRGITYQGAFWAKSTGQGSLPAFRGFEVVRRTSLAGATAESDPASRMVFVFYQPESDPGMFLLRPVFVEFTSAKAKLPAIGDADTFSAEVDLQLTAAVREKAGLKEVVVATSKWNLGGLDLDDSKTWRTFHVEESDGKLRYRDEFTAGWFAGIPLPSGEGGGPFKLVVSVTETADSEAPKYMERAAGYLRDNRKDITESVTNLIPPTK